MKFNHEAIGFVNSLLCQHYDANCSVQGIVPLSGQGTRTVYKIACQERKVAFFLILKLHRRKWRLNDPTEGWWAEYARRLGVPVPKVVYDNRDSDNPFSVPFMIMEYVTGKQLWEDAGWLEKNFEKFLGVFLKLHKPVDDRKSSLPDISVLRRRQYESYAALSKRSIIDSQLLDKMFQQLIHYYEVLTECLQIEWSSLLHGDLHPTNILIDEGGNPVILDWSETSRGDYCQDIAYFKARTLDFLKVNQPLLFQEMLQLYKRAFEDRTIKARMAFYLSAYYIEMVWRSSCPKISERWLLFFFQRLNETMKEFHILGG